MHSKLLVVLTLIVVVIIGVFVWPGQVTAPKKAANKNSSATSKTPAPSGFNKQQYSLADPNSIWIVVNKHRPLSPKTYVPNDLVVPAIPARANITSTESYVSQKIAPALKQLVDAGTAAGVHLDLQSGYRSYNFQVTLYNGYVQQQGQAVADTQSARPGYSEHQTGLAADLGSTTNSSCNVAQCFASTQEGKWLAANSYKYGFIIRYPLDKQSVTGYEYEPWHVRYVGVALATQMHNTGIETLEEFFGLGNAPDYQ